MCLLQLLKQDIHFSMPLCCVEVEQAAEDDLVELSEIERRNLGQVLAYILNSIFHIIGLISFMFSFLYKSWILMITSLLQTFQLDSMTDVDNSPQSLLAFVGNESVHGLYDFLLNYR